MLRFALLFSVLLFAGPAVAAAHSEDWYRQRWCANAGQANVELPTGLRADCITDAYAVAIAPSGKWADALGRALDYAAQTGKTPGIVLTQRNSDERHYVGEAMLIRLRWKLPFVIWTMDAQGRESGPE